MIAHLRGKLLAKHPNQAIVETGGVGYDVTISVPTFSDLPVVGCEVTLHIHTHVREDIIALYGFLRSAEKKTLRTAHHSERHWTQARDHHPQRHGRRRDGQRHPRQRYSPAYSHPWNRQEDRGTHGARTPRQTARRATRGNRGLTNPERSGRRCALCPGESRVSASQRGEGFGGHVQKRKERPVRRHVSRGTGCSLKISLLSNTESAKDQIQNIVTARGAGDLIQW